MRFKQHFSLYPRKNKSGTVWYYRTYDASGKRTPGTSTGFSSKAKAQAFCESLFSSGLLISSDHETKPLKLFISGFFDDNSAFVQNKLLMNQLTLEQYVNSTLKTYRSYFNKHIYPYWRNIQLKNITLQTTKDFREHVINKGIKRASTNTCMTVLNIIFKDLVDNGIIGENPCTKIKPLSEEKVKVGAFTLDECKLWLNHNYKENDFKIAVTVCCLTGLRINEVCGLNINNVFPDHITVDLQRQTAKSYKNVKDEQPRMVPIIPELYNFITSNFKENGFLISYGYTKIYNIFRATCIELNFEKRRVNDNIHIHSFRHFYNTYLLAENIPGVKVDAIIGHSDREHTMQKIYTNWDISHFEDVQKVNKKLWNLLKG